MSALSESEDKKINSIKKLSSLLQYTCEELDIDIKKDINDIEVKFEYQDDCFILNLQNILKDIKGYNNIKEYLEFDYLFVSRFSPKLFLEFLKDKPCIIRKQWFALFNELVVEFHNKKLKLDPKPKFNKKKLKKIIVKEENLLFDAKSKLDTNTFLDELINNNNILLMSNFTTESYIKIIKNNTDVIEDYEMTNITMETCIAFFVLTQILKHYDNKDLVKFYFLFLLSFIGNNRGKEKNLELSILAERTTKDNLYISSRGKNKLTGHHEAFMLYPKPYLKNIFFYKKQTQNSYNNLQDFLSVTMYNNFH